jgi:hypothetical protein
LYGLPSQDEVLLTRLSFLTEEEVPLLDAIGKAVIKATNVRAVSFKSPPSAQLFEEPFNASLLMINPYFSAN